MFPWAATAAGWNVPVPSNCRATPGRGGQNRFVALLAAGASFLVRLSSRSRLYTADHASLDRLRQTLVYYRPEKAQSQGRPPLQFRVVRVRGNKADVWLLTNVLDPRELNHRQIAQLVRWRWRNEGLFRTYKRMLGKVKLQSRTVKWVHREAEGSLSALQLLLALATRTQTHQGQLVVLRACARSAVKSCIFKDLAHFSHRLSAI